MGSAIGVGSLRQPQALMLCIASVPAHAECTLTKLILSSRRPPFSLCHWLCMLTLRSVMRAISKDISLHAVYSIMSDVVLCRHRYQVRKGVRGLATKKEAVLPFLAVCWADQTQ